ncbi:MAG: c-type cytochrome, partial [Planctomycetales bacterium]|nr:c-type cytochrome [Planctomycetales bacterium]
MSKNLMLRIGNIACAIVLALCAPYDLHADTLVQALQQESVAVLVDAARSTGSPVRGAILFADGKLACSSCHVAGANDQVGPDLAALDESASDTYLAESLLYPSRSIRAGYEQHRILLRDGRTFSGRLVSERDRIIVMRTATDPIRTVSIDVDDIEEKTKLDASAMPDNLIDQLRDRQQFLDLLRYMIHLRDEHHARQSTSGDELHRELPKELLGWVLIEQYHCGACHLDLARDFGFAKSQAPDLTWSNGRLDPSFVREFILDPRASHGDTSMPQLLRHRPQQEAADIATELTHFVMSLGNAEVVRAEIDPLARTRGEELFRVVGCLACHSLAVDNARVGTGVALDHVAEKYNLGSLTEFLEDPQKVRATGRMPNMRLTHWEASDIAAFLLRERPMPVSEFRLESKLVVRGRDQFVRVGCVRCHELPDVVGSDMTQTVANTRFESSRGCLSETAGAWPAYTVTDQQRQAIQAAASMPRRPFNRDEQLQLAMAKFNCVACHERNGWGGVSELDEYFLTTNPNLGPQGRLPPTLTGIGAKLNPKWLRQVLVSGRAIRPYMRTRMPQFGADNVGHLVQLFGEADEDYLPAIEPAIPSPTLLDDKAINTAGFELVSRDGLNCIACHTYQLKAAATMPAVDLTEMYDRLKKNWFIHYMRDPQRLSPRTVMPTFWPNGRAIRPEFLNGDSPLQIEAVWRYLADGRQARAPKGLVQEPMQLLATEEAVMLRRSWPQVGKRGIGVGYPGQVNLVYDAEQMRLAMLWRGPFADPSGVFRSQGHGVARPLGRALFFSNGPDLD